MKRMISIATAVMMAACSHAGNGNETPDASTHHPDATINPTPDAPTSSAKLTIFTIVLENHDYAEIVGSSNAPYINSLIAQGALATNYKDSGTHPSLPNYLDMISGATQYFGIIDLDPTGFGFPKDAPNLGTQLETANIKWRSYQESMGTACSLAAVGSLYAPKHDPFLYFTDQQTGANNLCANTNVDYTQFAADLGTNQYRYMWITPNMTSDGHDPSATSADIATGLRASDTWLSNEIPKIQASDAYKAGGVIFVTWDEAEGRNGDDPDKIPMIIISKKVKAPGMTSATALDHGSYLATVEDLLGLPRLATVTSKPNLMEFINQ